MFRFNPLQLFNFKPLYGGGDQRQSAPFGTWKSPITAENIVKAVVEVTETIVDPITSEVYHLERRPSEDGRIALVHTLTSRDIVGGGNWNVTTAVHEYGGDPAVVHDNIAYFSNLSDGRVYRVNVNGVSEPEAITPENKPYRFASFQVHPTQSHLLVCILEDHTVDTPIEVINSIAIIDTDLKKISSLISGADFYGRPKFSPNGQRIAWQQWDHPDMPWEGAQLYIGDILADGSSITVANATHVAGIPRKISAGYGTWSNNSTLLYISDESGYMNPYKFEGGVSSPLFPAPIEEDFGRPYWLLGYNPFTVVDAEGKWGLFTALRHGRDVLYAVDLMGTSSPVPVESPFTVIGNIALHSNVNRQIVFTAGSPTDKGSIVQYTMTSLHHGSFDILKSFPEDDTKLPKAFISKPEPMTLTNGFTGQPIHVVLYPPFNPDYSGSSDPEERPPCIVHIHGGPTSLSAQGLVWEKQAYTSRGWTWLDVNHGGSSGYGREYIERLSGNWGVVDVEDTIAAVKLLSSPPYDRIDKSRVVLRGGSAGGFTTLASVSRGSDLNCFAAATSLCGVADLAQFSKVTHKFESHYDVNLLGGTLEEIPDIYRQRSPLYNAHKVVTPLLILQGEADVVVPKEQALAIYQTIKDRGGVVEIKTYPGEGHYWRQEANLIDIHKREISWYEDILRLNR